MLDKMLLGYNTSKGFTHGGSFHADDVFSTAFLKIINPDIVVERGFVVPEGFDGIVYDIGNGVFDHHSLPRETRKNNIMYASFGKLWREFAPLLYSEYVVRQVDTYLISHLDNADNTCEFDSLSQAIASFNLQWDSETKDSRPNFDKAVSLALSILCMYIARYRSEEVGNFLVTAQYEKNTKNGLVYLEKYAPWKKVLEDKVDVKAVLYKSNRGGYNLELISDSGLAFPTEWLGKRNYEGVDGFIFCHAGNWLTVFETKEQAIYAYENLVVLSNK